jgi:predicted nucleotidyltransferase
MKKQTLNEVIKTLTDILPDLKKKYDISSLGIFGSYAKNTNTKLSDIDILIEFKKPIGFKFFELKEQLELKLQNKIDLTTKKALKPQIKNQILKEVIPIE